jgi:Holliday junction resolvasome RuvABC ATP-dependent DNA helicase subunit
VTELAELLTLRGISVWLDVLELRPGQQWLPAIEEAITSSGAALVAVGRSGVGPWQAVEMRAALMMVVQAERPVIPVLLHGAPERVELPIFLSGRSWVDLREGYTAASLDRLVWGISGRKPASSSTPTGDVSHAKKSARLEEVFCTSGLPGYTYIEPSIYQRVARDLRQAGKHVLICGPSGSGKTCLIFRILGEMGMQIDREFLYISALDESADQRIRSALSEAISRSHSQLIVVDDFHLLHSETRIELGRGLKRLADETFSRSGVSKFVLIGISTSAEGLLFNSTDLGLRLGIYRMPIAEAGDLSRLLRRGEERLAIEFLNRDGIVREASGSYYICQYLAQEACLENQVYKSADELKQLSFSVSEVRDHLLDELQTRFLPYMTAFVKASGNTRDERLPFAVLLALIASIPKSLIPFSELVDCSGDHRSSLLLVKARFRYVITSCIAGGKFSKYLFYEEDSELLSIEDPIFRYFLDRCDLTVMMDGLGISEDWKSSLLQLAGALRRKHGVAEPSASPVGLRNLVFICYSHRDQKWLEQLQSHLAPIVRNREFVLWSDRRIEAGQQWREEVRKAISRAKVAVLLVSPDFLASDFISNDELPPLLRAAQDEGLRILWVPISDCLYRATEIVRYHAASDPARPLDSLPRSRRNQEMSKIVSWIEQALGDPD